MEVAQPVWRNVALQMMPELAERLKDSETPYLLWADLMMAFDGAYVELKNQSLIKQIYEYAAWCEHQPRGQTAEDDLATCVSVCFYEHIPKNPQARKDMPNWFTKEDFGRMRDVFRYHTTEDEFRELEGLFALTTRPK